MFGSALMMPWPSNGCMKPCSFKICNCWLVTLPQETPCLAPSAQLCGYRHFLALAKTSLWWMSPRWGASALQVPVSTLEGEGGCGLFAA